MSPTDKNPENVQPDAGEKPFDTAPEPRPRKDKRSKQKDSLPLIAFNNRSLREVVDDCLKAAKQANTPPRLFQQGNMLTRIRSRGPEAFVEPMTIDSLRGFLERAATFSRTYKKDGETKIVLKPLPLDYVRDILALPSWSEEVFPMLHGIMRCPFFAANGHLVIAPGYHEESKIWYEPAPDLNIDPVPSSPTDKEIEVAKHWLTNELLGDFPFQSDADRTNAVAYLLSPFLREMIQGPIPMALIEAPAAGTGKGLLANALAIPSIGTFLETIPQRQSDDEWRKAITAKLIEMPTHILFDNLTGTLRSAALEAALTSEVWADRFLGESRMVRLKIRNIWMATGNNLQIAGDLYRRNVWIRLDAKTERPEDRDPSCFQHPQLLQWAKANRSKLIWSALTIIQAWIVRGRQAGTEVMGSYESWAATLGGILKMLDMPGFLTNLQKNRLNADDELLQLGNFVETWKKEFGDEEVSVNQLYTMVAESKNLLPFVMEPEKDHGRKVRLGRYLSKHRDRTVGTDQIVSLTPDKRSRCLRYRLVNLAASADQEKTATPDEEAATETVRRIPRDFPGLLDDRPVPPTPKAVIPSEASDDSEEYEGDDFDEDELDDFEYGPVDPDDLDA